MINFNRGLRPFVKAVIRGTATQTNAAPAAGAPGAPDPKSYKNLVGAVFAGVLITAVGMTPELRGPLLKGGGWLLKGVSRMILTWDEPEEGKKEVFKPKRGAKRISPPSFQASAQVLEAPQEDVRLKEETSITVKTSAELTHSIGVSALGEDEGESDVALIRANVAGSIKKMAEITEKLKGKITEIEQLYDDPKGETKINPAIKEALGLRTQLHSLYKKVEAKVYNPKADFKNEDLQKEKEMCIEAHSLMRDVSVDMSSYKNKLEMRKAFKSLENSYEDLKAKEGDWEKIKGEKGEMSPELAAQTKAVKEGVVKLDTEYKIVDKKMKAIHVSEEPSVKEKQTGLLRDTPEMVGNISTKMKKHEEKISDDAVFIKLDSEFSALEKEAEGWKTVAKDENATEETQIAKSRKLKDSAAAVLKTSGLAENAVGRSEGDLQSGRRDTIVKVKKAARKLDHQADLISARMVTGLEGSAPEPKKSYFWSNVAACTGIFVTGVALGGVVVARAIGGR
ncbi:MAG: hypothetical protein V4489_02865 [Chlamydiota bacterium]